VVVPHKGITNRFFWMNDYFGVNSAKSVLQTTNHVYDSAVWQLFWPLINGGITVIPLPSTHLTAEYFSYIIEKHQVTMTDFVPSVFNVIVEQLESNNDLTKKLGSLCNIVIGGEEIVSETVYKFKRMVPDITITNLYGPTEASIGCVFHKVTGEEGNRIPIGKPISNMSIFILDNNLKPLPIGVPGEIYISGTGLAYGYLNDIEKTEKAFIESPFQNAAGEKLYKTGDLARYLDDGSIDFLGRVDNQVKIRGFRIELGEIESKLLNYDCISEAVVVLKEAVAKNKYLCAYYVSGSEIEIEDLRSFLASKLPDYMIPVSFVQIERMPLTSSGKVDRKALELIDSDFVRSTEYKAPKNNIEKVLVDIWQEVLEKEKVGINDNFFDLGGDSIKSIQISARLQNYGFSVEIKDILRLATVEKLSKQVKSFKNNIYDYDIVGEVELAPIQKYFFEQAFTDKHHWNLGVMLYKEDAFDKEKVLEVIGKILEHHDALRMVYKEGSGQVVQINRPKEDKNLLDFLLYDFINEDNYDRKIKEEAYKIQQSIDLRNGPLVKLGLFKTRNGDQLLIVIHHLDVDGISWIIIL
jgi:acyl carrier protein